MSVYANSGITSSLPSGVIVMWSGSIGSIPSGYALCDGTNGTPNLTDRFIVGAGNTYNPDDVGGQTHMNTTVGNNVPPTTTDVCQDNIVSSADSGYMVSDLFETMPPYYALAYIIKV
jgi:hypothetical protein